MQKQELHVINHPPQLFLLYQLAKRTLVLDPVFSVASHSPDLLIICIITMTKKTKTTQNSLLMAVELSGHVAKTAGRKMSELWKISQWFNMHVIKSATCINHLPTLSISNSTTLKPIKVIIHHSKQLQRQACSSETMFLSNASSAKNMPKVSYKMCMV